MKTLNPSATKIFLRLVEGLGPGEARRIDSTNGTFMPVLVDFLSESPEGVRFYAVAHRFEQNGDLCPDPDVEFRVLEGRVYPTAIDQMVGYSRHVELDESGRPVRWNPRGQADLTSFCNLWMRNIKAQQGL